jgi:hypothetical protein
MGGLQENDHACRKAPRLQDMIKLAGKGYSLQEGIKDTSKRILQAAQVLTCACGTVPLYMCWAVGC